MRWQKAYSQRKQRRRWISDPRSIEWYKRFDIRFSCLRGLLEGVNADLLQGYRTSCPADMAGMVLEEASNRKESKGYSFIEVSEGSSTQSQHQ